LSWRQLDGERRLTPPAAPNERQTPKGIHHRGAENAKVRMDLRLA